MIAEIIGGIHFHSMALLADGWHMGAHVAIFAIAAVAYALARHYEKDSSFIHGTQKFNALGGFTSAVVLSLLSAMMAFESIQRLIEPEHIEFNQSIFIAVIGLPVNLVSAFLLRDHHHHGPSHAEHPEYLDLNLRAAYIHVLADALTSILAVAALTAGKYLGWTFLDPVMGIVSAVIVGRMAWTLIKLTSRVLLDRS